MAITDANDAPTLTVPTGGSVTEDAVASTITGSLTSSDPENATLTYLMPGKTAVDGSYSVTGTYGTLVLNASTGAYTYTLDNSASAVQSLGVSSSETETFSVQVTDGSNTPTAQNLSFTIKGANDAPSSVALSSTSVVENSAGAVVGALSASDAEGTAVSYTIAAAGDGALFEVDGSNNLKLKSSVTADLETKSSYSVTVNATDGTATTSKVFSISVGDVNEAPTLTVPTGGSVTEDAVASTITGSLTSSDPENATLTYLMPGKTAVDGSYSVTGTYGTLVLNASTGAYTYTLDNSASAVQSLGVSSSETETFSVQVTDGSNTPTAQNLSFTIKGANDAPTIAVSGLTSIAENSVNAVAATVSSTDAEDGTLTVGLSGNGRDDAKFEVVDGKLRIKTSADYEAQDTYRVQLKVTDDDNTVVLKNLEFSVKDSAEDVGGKVVDGYVAGATIFQDLDNDNILDAGEPFTVTSSTGEFTLSGIIASKTASLKMISGFDIGTNAPIVTSLGVPTTASGNVIASPVGTVTSLAQANDTSVGLSTSVDRVATYFGVTETSQANLDIINDDPLLSLKSSDANVVAAARDVFEANQYVMALAHGAESLGAYTANQVDALVQQALVAEGYNGVPTLAGTATSTYQKIGADAFLDIVSDRIVAPDAVTTENAFQLSDVEVVWNDYDPDTGVTVQNRAQSSTTSGQLALSNTANLNLQNLLNAANESGEYNTPTLSFALDKIPTGSGSGAITFKIVDGSDAVRDDNERYIELEVAVNWEGTGDSAQITVPVQTASGHYISASLGRVDFTIANLDSDTISVASGGVNYPSTLDVKFASLINKLEGVGSKSLLKVGGFNLTVETTLPLADSSASTITSINTNVNIVDGSPVTAFISDAAAHEGDNTPTAVVQLNRAHSEDITLNYTISAKSGDTASAGSDFTATTGTVTILVGLTSETIALPVLNDNVIESDESFSVTLSGMSYGSIARDTASVTLTDSTRALGSTGEVNFLATETMEKYVADITTEIVAKYNAYSVENSSGWSINGDVIKGYIDGYVPGLKVIVGTFYDLVAAEVVKAAANTDIEQFASNLMIANAATKLFDPISYLGVQVNGDGTYVSGKSLSTLQNAISADYATFISLSTDTIGDVFGEDTATNFANATVSILTTGNDTETLSASSEIIATFDGVDTIKAGGGNDKVIGGKDVDTFYGEAGNDHLYGYSGNDVLDGGDGNDKIVGGLGDDTISGGVGDDYVLAQTGDDTISTGTGTDQVLGGSGDDAITIDGTGNKTIDGGAGTDRVILSQSGVTGFDDFTISYANSTLSMAALNGDILTLSNIEEIAFGSNVYTFYERSSSGYTRNSFIDSTNQTIYSVDNSDTSVTSSFSNTSFGSWEISNFGFTTSANVSVNGSSQNQYIFLGGTRSEFTGSYEVDLGGGNDRLILVPLNSDSIDMGAGDDYVRIEVNASSFSTPDWASFSSSLLDGGAGTDTLSFMESKTGGATLTLTSGGAENFENIEGTLYRTTNTGDTIIGDSNNNSIFGLTGADILYGRDGDDIIYAETVVSYDSGRVYEASENNYDDKLYGEGGDDILVGNAGDNTLDGGTGADTITTGSGSDTVILRAGDGGTELTDADIITDFTDGVDVLGLDNNLLYTELTRAQGTGSYANDTIISITDTAENLAILKGISASDVNYLDFASMSTGNQNFTGTIGDDVFIGAAGVDTVTTNIGTDIVLTSSGDDAITIDGTGNKTIDGGAGTDRVILSQSGVTGFDDFTISYANSTLSMAALNGDILTLSNIEEIAFGSNVYTFYERSSSGYTRNSFIDSTNQTIYSVDNSDTSVTSSFSNTSFGSWEISNFGFTTSANVSVNGSSQNQYIFLGGTRSEFTGSYEVDLGGGNDRLILVPLNSDSIDMGAGDDYVRIEVNASSFSTPDWASFSSSLLDGGAGTDTLSFMESKTGGATLTLTSGGAENFENIEGTLYRTTNTGDTIIGDSNNNSIFGLTGADILYGRDGDDIIYAETVVSYDSGRVYEASENNYDDKLYGEGGDDILVGNAGDNTLDGGTGADTITTGSGSDQIILRIGDGGSELSDADIITDFTDGSDDFGFTTGLSFGEISWAQGSGDYVNDTIIKAGSEYLAILQGIDADLISEADFEPVDFA
nr:VCBS domain-containing protein [Planktotalea frisia]